MDIKIGLLSEEDLSQVMKIEYKSFNSPWSRHSFLKDINENPYSIYLAAYNGKKLVGYIGGWLVIDELHITNLAVDPEYRKQGIATRLLNTIIEIIKEKEMIAVTLEVRESNEPAINLYKNNGFIQTGKRINYYQDNGEDALIMRKELENE
ncbi:MAG: ribosomal protein S18-alanine N-acetyltransferase [Bacillota bacterium]